MRIEEWCRKCQDAQTYAMEKQRKKEEQLAREKDEADKKEV